MTVAMSSKDREKVQAFIDYAYDTEGMRYTLTTHHGKYKAVSAGNYDPQVQHALVRNFKQEWGSL